MGKQYFWAKSSYYRAILIVEEENLENQSAQSQQRYTPQQRVLSAL
jgi:hypothetical protein